MHQSEESNNLANKISALSVKSISVQILLFQTKQMKKIKNGKQKRSVFKTRLDKKTKYSLSARYIFNFFGKG